MTRLIVYLLFCLPLVPLSAQEVPQMSLKEAVGYAYEHDKSIENARLNIEDADQQIVENRAIGLPKINASVDYQYFFQIPVSVLPEAFEEIVKAGNGGELPEGFSRQAEFAFRNNFNLGAELNTMIFDGSYFIGLRAARLYREYVGQEMVATQKDLQNRVVEAYLPPLILKENLGILDKNISNLEKLLNETRETYKAGFVEQLDVDRLELSLANLQVEKDNLERQKEVTINVLKLTIGYPIDEPLEVSDEIDDLLEAATPDDLEGPINFYGRPEYKVAELGVTLNQLNIDRYRSGYLPDLRGFANWQYGYQGNELFRGDGFWAPNTLAGIRLNIPIFDGFDRKAKVQRARVAMAISQNQKIDLERVITLEIQNARIDYRSAQERVASQKKNLELADRIYQTTQIKYREGVGSSLEVTQAEQGLYQTQQNYTQALFELLVAKSTLYRALGK
ncbi:MAG: TolC family protein [Bacteroidota bacterium]